MPNPCITALLLMLAPASGTQVEAPPQWTSAQFDRLASWMENSQAEALNLWRNDKLNIAIATEDATTRDKAATDAALELARAILFGCTRLRERAGWQIDNDDTEIDVVSWLKDANLIE
jgi:hypothetical protein